MDCLGRIGLSLVIFVATALAVGFAVHDYSVFSRIEANGTAQESSEGIQTVVDSASLKPKSGVVTGKMLKGVVGVFVVNSEEIEVSPAVYQAYSEGDIVDYYVVSVTVPAAGKGVGEDTNISSLSVSDASEVGANTIEGQLTSKVKVQAEKNSKVLLTHYGETYRTYGVCAVLLSILSVAAVLYLLLPLSLYGF